MGSVSMDTESKLSRPPQVVVVGRTAALASSGGRTYDRRMQNMSFKSLICGLLVGSLAACAGTPPAPSAQASSIADAKVVAQRKAVPPGCVATGSRLQRSSGDCAGTGSSYTQDQLKRTGAMDPAQGLSLVDPSVTTTSH